MPTDLTADAFLPHRDTTFLVDSPPNGDSITLRLVSVERLGLHPGAPRGEPFSLLFVGPAQPVMPQGIHELSHDAMGRVSVFLVPVGPGPEGPMRYEAVFN